MPHPDNELQPHALLPGRERFRPPKGMTAAERKHWAETMNALPAGWFGRETLPLLRLLCHYLAVCDAAMKVIKKAIGDDGVSIKQFNKQMTMAARAADMVIKLSYQLRLTPKSRGEYARKKDETNSRASPIRPWEVAIGADGVGDDASN